MNSKMYFRNTNHNYLLFLLTFRLKFGGGNYDRNGIHSSSTKVISDTTLAVYPLRSAFAKKMRNLHEMTRFVLKIAHLAILMELIPLLEKVSSYGLSYSDLLLKQT